MTAADDDRGAPEFDARAVPFALIAWAVVGFALAVDPRPVLVVVAAVAVCGALAGLVEGLRAHALRVVAVALFGVAVAVGALVRVDAVREHPAAELATRGAHVEIDAVVTSDPRRTGGGVFQVIGADLRVVRHHDAEVRGRGAIVVTSSDRGWADVGPGTVVRFDASLAAATRPDLTVAAARAPDAPRILAPPPWHHRAATALRERFAEACAAGLSADPAGLLPGLVVGDTSHLSVRVQRDFTAAGLSHLTAVSGANVSIVLGAVLLLVRVLGVPPRLGAVAAGIVLCAFVFVARPDPSVLRAAAMGAILLLALVVGRRRQALPALAVSVTALVIVRPELATSWGFALSVVATAGLIVVVPRCVERLRERGWPRALAEAVVVAVVAGVVTAPLIAAMSGTVSLVSMLANLLVAPVIAAVTIVGAITAVVAAVDVGAARYPAALAEYPLRWVVAVAEQAAVTKGAVLQVPTGLAGGLWTVAGLVATGAIVWWLLRAVFGVGVSGGVGGAWQDRVCEFSFLRAAPGIGTGIRHVGIRQRSSRAGRRRASRRARGLPRDRWGRRQREPGSGSRGDPGDPHAGR
ncbi:ComEC operon protein [Rhodococcus rhodnii LMG 5362]|uniref:ComEC operon protein n=1 Tax=Rhodococcus rhodnii LMG 5362 TaxID=1273125 RepID=R7WM92_9NOCA|nr:ComEC operon protein [Rhodococcus rhodnii LMG 5362]